MINNRAVWAVVPASGIGSRMQAALPKQYLRFQGKTILEHTLDRLSSFAALDGMVLVLHPEDQHWDGLNYQSDKELKLAKGGAERVHSVESGLSLLKETLTSNALILVHDAVRPLVTVDEIKRVVEAADGNDHGAILAMPVSDTIKRQSSEERVSETVDRDELWRAFTPQVFELGPLLSAVTNAINQESLVSDDSSAMELAGYRPELVKGAGTNIKITVPEDLLMAEQIWLNQRNE